MKQCIYSVFLGCVSVLLLVAMCQAALVARQTSIGSSPLLTVQAPDFACLPIKQTVSGQLEILTGKKGENNGDISTILSGTPGLGETLLASWDLCYKLSPVMLFEINSEDAERLGGMTNNNNNSVFIDATPGDVNEWRQYRNGWFSWTFRFFFGILSGVTAVMALYKLIAYIAAYGFQLSIPQFCLFVAFVANMFRCIYHALDPIYMGKVWPGTIAHLLVTISVPANIITTMLLALYWKEILTSGKIKIVVFVSKMKLPFAIVCVLSFGIEIASSVLRGVTVGGFGFMAIISGAIYIIIVSLMTIFFAVYGAKVLLQLNNSDSKSHASGSENRRRSVARNATFMVLISSIMNTLWVVGMILVVIPRVFYTPMGFHAVWVVVWLGVIGSQLSQILAFRTPSRGGNSSRTNSNTRTTTSGRGTHENSA